MDDIADLHDRAMKFADQADQVRRQGDLHRYGELIRQAFENERSAATLVAADLQLEPTRSVLHRSAAALAIEAGAPDVALELIATALEGNPPQAIAEELKSLRSEGSQVRAGARRSASGIRAHFTADSFGSAASGERMFTLPIELSLGEGQELGGQGVSLQAVMDDGVLTVLLDAEAWTGDTPASLGVRVTSPSRTSEMTLVPHVPGSTRLEGSIPWADEEAVFTVELTAG